MGDPLFFIDEAGWPYPDEGNDAEELEPIDLRGDPDDDVIALHTLPRRAFDDLTPTERAVVTARFGLDGFEARTMAQLHHELGLSRERIRHALDDALAKLRVALADA